MVLSLEEWKEILNTLKIDNQSIWSRIFGLLQWWLKVANIKIDNEFSDILEQIKENLKNKDLNTYKRWEETSFSVREELFWIVYNKLILPSSLLDIAVACCPLAVVKCLINERGADANLTCLTYQAVIGGNLEVIKYFVYEKGIDINTQDNIENTLLHWAAVSDRLEVVEYFIYEKGIDVNTQDMNGNTPLHWAAGNDHLEVVKYLIEKGADINAENHYRSTPLDWAATGGSLKVMKYLISERKAYIDLKDLACRIIRSSNLEVVRCFINEKGDSVDLINLTHNTATHGSLEVMRYLIDEREVDVNATNDNRVTALHIAAKGGYLLLVEYLVDNGADINAKDYYSCTPLDWAATRGHLEVMRYLIDEKMVDVNFTKIAHMVTKDGYLKVVRYLIDEKGAGVNLTDLAHAAAMHRHLEVVKYFVDEKMVDVNEQGENGSIFLHQAAMGGSLEVAKYLIEKGADVNVLDKNGQGSLYFASYHGNVALVKLLLEKGADVDLQDNNKTTLYLGNGCYGDSCIKLLIAHGVKFNAEKPEYLLKDLDTDLKRSISEYWDECLKEIEKMKQEKTDRGITLYDVLVSKNNKLASHIRKEDMRGKLEKINYKSEFPIYGNDLERQFKIGVQRLDALNTGEKIIKRFDSLGEGPFNLKIAEHLSNECIENLEKATKPIEDNYKPRISEEIPKLLDGASAAELVRGASCSLI